MNVSWCILTLVFSKLYIYTCVCVLSFLLCIWLLSVDELLCSIYMFCFPIEEDHYNKIMNPRLFRLSFLFGGLFILYKLRVIEENPWTKPQMQIFFLKRASLYALSKRMRMNIVNTEIMPIYYWFLLKLLLFWPEICQMRTRPPCTQKTWLRSRWEPGR